MRYIPELLPECIRIPLLHRAQLQQQRRVRGGPGIDPKAVSLDPKRDRPKERINRGERLTGEERASETIQTILPKRTDAADIALERGRNFVEPYAHAAAHRTAGAQLTETGMHLGGR